MKTELQNVQELWASLKTNGDRYKPIWDDISRYTGISVQPDYIWNNNQSKDRQPDEWVDDPTSSISVNQAADYLVGIMWGTGDKVLDIIPSRYVLEYADIAELEEWYKFATDQTLYHMNHSDSGLHTALGPYARDQFAFGTSGIGVFANDDFVRRVADNALLFRNYGIDNTRIDEGKSGLIEIVFSVHRWPVNRIVGDFAQVGGDIDPEKYAKLPNTIRKAYEGKDYNKEFALVCGVFPRSNFDPKLKGKRGAKYRGVWFLDEDGDNTIFYEEDFAEKPIAMARQIKVRGEVYGRSSGTLLISSIKCVNFMVGNVMEILEKMNNPSLGMFNNAIMGDSVLDTSPNGLTIFNSTLAGATGQPFFQLYDVGNPDGIIKFLLPYLNDKITTGFKVDALLDFNSAKDMTATESLQRYAIRGKSLSSMLQQQKIEALDIFTRRSISLLMIMKELGIDPTTDQGRARALMQRGKGNRVIPEAVLQVIRDGRPWFELKWNNELEKLTRTEAVQNLVQILQSIIAIAGVYPDIVHAVNWHKLLKDINDNLYYNNQIVLSEDGFKATITNMAQQRSMAMQMQAGQAGAQINKDLALAGKANKEAQNAGRT